MNITHDIAITIADREGVSVSELPPLYETIDPEHLQAFVASPLMAVDLEFIYYGYTVILSATGEIRVEPLDAPWSQRV